MASMFDFTGRVVLVTGAASGIGRATAEMFARHGAAVAIVDRDKHNGRRVAEGIVESGGEAIFIGAELSRAEEARDAVHATYRRLGGLEAAVNCAGILGEVGRLNEISNAGWYEVIANNLDSVFWCMKHEIEVMLKSGGAIVNVSSAAGIVAFPMATPYAAAKHAIVGLTRTAAVEYAVDNLRINAIAPGGVDTPLIRATTCATPEGRAQIEGMHPMKRLAQPEEVASAALYLCSSAASFITGVTLPVDGGWVAP
jgi:NAD(P)-dependent dehydrogenase (short-subunit alcohol dehydrogenase family)